MFRWGHLVSPRHLKFYTLRFVQGAVGAVNREEAVELGSLCPQFPWCIVPLAALFLDVNHAPSVSLNYVITCNEPHSVQASWSGLCCLRQSPLAFILYSWQLSGAQLPLISS